MVLSLCLCLPMLRAQSQSDIRGETERLFAGGKYQTQLPEGVHPDAPPSENPTRQRPWSGASGRAGTPRASGVPGAPASPWNWNLSGLGPLAQILLWTLLGVVVSLGLTACVRALRNRRSSGPAQKLALAATAARESAAPALADYEQLALTGRFTEAVHALLLHSFAALSKQRALPFPRAATGREILASVGGFQQGDGDLVGIFRTSERAWFGGTAAGADDYSRCRELFLRWQAAWPRA